MEARFEALGCADRYRRFEAIDGRALSEMRSPLSPGERGCFMSHYHCIVEGAEGERHLHIVEDDVVFAPQTPFLLGGATSAPVHSWDILFTDIFIPTSLNAVYNFMQAYRDSGMVDQQRLPIDHRMPSAVAFLELKGIGFAGATSYVVNRNSRHKLRRLLDAELDRGPDEPIDMVYRKLSNAGEIKVACTIPFLTSITSASLRQTTIGERGQDQASALASYLLRAYFYLGKNNDDLATIGGDLTAQLDDSGTVDPLLAAFRFFLSDRFRSF